MLSSKSRSLAAIGPIAVVTAGLLAMVSGGQAKAEGEDKAVYNERCATRLSITLLGKSAEGALLGSATPQTEVDAMLGTPDFQERFARFVNAAMNEEPGETSVEDSAYHLTKYVLANGKPWAELFNGPYMVVNTGGDKPTPTVQSNANGLGYFRSPPWLRRYAGNEPDGYKLATAYRMENNVLGLTLVASTNAPGADITAGGRKAQPCAQCHFENWYALDKVATILTKRTGNADNITFGAQFAPEADVLGTKIHNDKELIDTMVASDQFRFRTCRLVFNFLYGRDEYKREGTLFDKCTAEFKSSGKVQAGIAAVAKDPSFCQ